MITAQVENLTERLEELKGLFPQHYQELSLHVGRFDLDPQYDDYLRRDAAGQVLFVTLRNDGHLCGYFVGFVTFGLHYRQCLTLSPDIFYLSPEHRNGSPKAALMLFREVEREARRRGVNLWFVGSKLHRDTSRLFKRLGFEPVEQIHAKWLG